MRVTTKGQVTIPQDVRDFAGFQPGTEVEFFIGDDGVVRVLPAGRESQARGCKARWRRCGGRPTPG